MISILRKMREKMVATSANSIAGLLPAGRCQHVGATMIRVLVVSQSPLLCSIVEAVIENEADMQLVGRSATADAALEQAAQCNVILAQRQLPHNGTLFLLGTIVTDYPHVKALVMDLPRSESEQIVHFIEQGAAGYVLREDSAEELLHKIRAVHKGRPRIDPQIAAALMARIAELANSRPQPLAFSHGLLELTEREREVLRLIGRNFTNREIARHLVIEIGTVKNHVHSILKKLDVSNRQQAAAYLPALYWSDNGHSIPNYL